MAILSKNIQNGINLVYPTLLNDLADFLPIPAEQVYAKAKDGCSILCNEFKNWNGSREDFYRSENDCFLFDLAQLNTYESYWQSRIIPLNVFRDMNVLDFGCGIGTVSLFMGALQNKVQGYDVGAKVLEFAEFRRKRIGLSNVTFTDNLPTLSQFDLVVALDVLEHVEDLRGMILQLGEGMKSEAILYHYDSFYQDHPHPLHYRRPDEFFTWLEEAGFININDKWAIKR